MATYVVMEPNTPDAEDARRKARLVREGFSVLGFLLPPLWLLWHRLPMEALVVFILLALIAALGETTPVGVGASALSLAVSLYVALEGPALRVAALRRRGWLEWGVVVADNRAEAELRYASAIEPEADEAELRVPLPWRPHPTRPAAGGPALGLLGYPGR